MLPTSLFTPEEILLWVSVYQMIKNVVITQWGPVELVCPSICLSVCLVSHVNFWQSFARPADLKGTNITIFFNDYCNKQL